MPHIQEFIGRRVHMIGIGGSSMNGLALMLQQMGCLVSGSDRSDGYLLPPLRAAGIPIAIGHAAENVHGAELVIYTAAIPATNPERQEAEKLGIPTMERAVLLGQLMDGYRESVCVCGAHGKTTTTSMLTQVLMGCGLDPTVHIGGQLDAIGGSTRIGAKDVFVAESCEFNRSFLHFHPTLALVLNIDADHLDCYKDIDEIEQTFGQFLSLLPEDGLAIGYGEDERIKRLLTRLPRRSYTYGMTDSCDYYPAGLSYDETGHASFKLMFRGEELGQVTLRVPGSFMALNAMGALAVAHQEKADMAIACRAMNDFIGAHRRFELTGIIDGVRIYHDYGHNPTEMRNVLSVAKLQKHNRLWAVMQPHTFSRVKTLFPDYLTCTKDADITLVTDICAAREIDPGDIHSTMLVDGMKKNGINAVYTPSFEDTKAYLESHWQPGDLVLTMGCGDINKLNDMFGKGTLK